MPHGALFRTCIYDIFLAGRSRCIYEDTVLLSNTVLAANVAMPAAWYANLQAS